MHVDTILRHKGNNVITAGPDTGLREAARILLHNHIGSLVVVDPEGTVLGILSERDIVRAVALFGESAFEDRVSDLMSRDVTTCSFEDNVQDLMAIMTEKRIRHIPVIVGGHLAGMVSIGDVVKHTVDQCRIEVDSLRDYVTARDYLVAH